MPAVWCERARFATFNMKMFYKKRARANATRIEDVLYVHYKILKNGSTCEMIGRSQVFGRAMLYDFRTTALID